MPIATMTILEWCGVSTPPRRASVRADLVPEPDNLNNLVDEDEEGIKGVCAGYSKRRNQPFSLSRVAVKRLVSLMQWVQDKAWLNVTPKFENGITCDNFITEIREASKQARLRAEQKKIRESLIASEFTVQLKTRQQWD